MIAVDTNILVAAHRRDSAQHARAAAAVRGLAEASTPWALPWPCLHEFVAIVTHPRVFVSPTTPVQALDQTAAWLESPSVRLLHEGPDHLRTLRSLVASTGTRGGRVHDARVAAICLDHGVREIWTADRDFSRYPLRTRNPLVTHGRGTATRA